MGVTSMFRPGRNRNGHLSWRGFLPGHMDGVLPGRMDGVCPGTWMKIISALWRFYSLGLNSRVKKGTL